MKNLVVLDSGDHVDFSDKRFHRRNINKYYDEEIPKEESEALFQEAKGSTQVFI